MVLVLSPQPPVLLPVTGLGEFPVRNVYCVGRNYAEHTKEMGGDVRDPPFFFTKFASAVVPVGPGGASIAYPPATQNLHHEIELVLAIGRGGADVPVAAALDHVMGYAVGLDMTRRDLQGALRDKGRPWDAGKNFGDAAPVGPIHPVAGTGHPKSGAIWLDVDGARRQTGDLADLIWSVAEIIAHLSGLWRLEPGDLVFTGTPAGVGAVTPGQVMTGGVAGLGEIRVTVRG